MDRQSHYDFTPVDVTEVDSSAANHEKMNILTDGNPNRPETR